MKASLDTMLLRAAGTKGGTGPTSGMRGQRFSFTFPDGTPGTKLSYHHTDEPAMAYVYQHGHQWFCATIDAPAVSRLSSYISVPAYRVDKEGIR